MRISSLEFTPRRLLLAGCLVLGGLSLTGCSDDVSPSDPPGEGSFIDGEYVKPVSSGDATDHVRIYCENGNLVKRHDDKQERDSVYRYVDHPACDDGVLDETDTFSRDVFQNEYLTPVYDEER